MARRKTLGWRRRACSSRFLNGVRRLAFAAWVWINNLYVHSGFWTRIWRGHIRDAGTNGGLAAGATSLVQRVELGVRQLDGGGGHVLFQMRDLGRAGYRQHHRAALQQPGQRDLAARGLVGCGRRVEQFAGLDQLAGGQREPGDEAYAMLGAIVEHILAATVADVKAVLHGGDLEVARSSLDLLDRHFAQAGMADHAAGLQLAHGGELFIARSEEHTSELQS